LFVAAAAVQRRQPGHSLFAPCSAKQFSASLAKGSASPPLAPHPLLATLLTSCWFHSSGNSSVTSRRRYISPIQSVATHGMHCTPDSWHDCHSGAPGSGSPQDCVACTVHPYHGHTVLVAQGASCVRTAVKCWHLELCSSVHRLLETDRPSTAVASTCCKC
jgi:hypothetical protein